MTAYNKILAITLGQRSLLLAELTAKSAGGRPGITNLAEFPFPDGITVANPVELGQALGKYLAALKVQTRDLIMGLPARRLLTRRKDLPPASPSVAASTLRLQAETEFSSIAGAGGGGGGVENDTFVADFVGQSSASDPSSVLLVATAQSAVDQCQAFAKAAGLKLRGITASGAALARATSTLQHASHHAHSVILALSPGSGGAELIVQQGTTPTQLRHIAMINPAGSGGEAESYAVLAGEIRRSVASLQRNGSPLILSLWKGDVDADASGVLEQRLGMPIQTPDLASLAQPMGAHQAQSLSKFAPAIAVAIAALHPAGLPLDFLHSRLAPPREPSKHRPLIIGVGAVAAVILVVAGCYLDIQLKQNRLADINSKISAQSGEVKVAKAAADRLDTANAWIHRTKRFIPCLRDLTALFPDEGTIWATSLSLSADNKGVLTGKAAGESQVRALKDLMLKSKQFHDPRTTYQEAHVAAPRGGSSGSGEINFTIQFSYVPQEAKK